MKTDMYTKVLLTIIAFCMLVIVFREVDLIPKAHAASPLDGLRPGVQYGLVPLNADGSIDVNIKSHSSPLPVSVTDNIDVNIVGIRTMDELDVNIDEVGDFAINGSLPVTVVK
jgi:hypothetical protein